MIMSKNKTNVQRVLLFIYGVGMFFFGVLGCVAVKEKIDFDNETIFHNLFG